MADVDIAPQFGAELKDGFKPVNAWVANGIGFLDDIQQFYRERSAIEKEYSQKLGALAKKYFEKKAKKQSQLSVGDTPTVTPGSLESASMTTWTVQLTTLESRAAEHDRFAGQLITNLAQPLQNLQNKYEDLRKSHAEYAAKLEKERDGTYADLKKTKGKYDSVCQEVENRRKKVEGSFEHGKSKAQGQYQQQLSDMRNAKNTYLIAINVTNKQKERYYHEYLPELLDSLQSLSEARTTAVNKFWSSAAAMEREMLVRSTKLLDHLSGEIPRNNPLLDSMMFVRHNAAQWQDPPDFAFEPSPVWLDDDVMASDPASKTFLMNILAKSKASLGEIRKECDAKRREVEGAKRVRQAIREGKDKRDEAEVVRAQFVHQEALHEAERRKTNAEVEVSTILSAVGDISLGMRKHAFKNETFRLPTNCDLCGDRIWGLSAKGLICNDCGFTCHTKCELKVPADCPGELNKEQKKSIKAERQAVAAAHAAAPPPTSNGANGGAHRDGAPSLHRSDTIGSMNTLSSGYAAAANRSVSGTTITTLPTTDTPSTAPRASTSSARPRVMAPPPAAYIKNGDDTAPQQKGKMLFPYQASSDGEITISDGETFTVLEPDDGSGWIKIKPSTFGSPPGLVPASYVELSTPEVPGKEARPVSTAASVSTTSLNAASDAESVKPKKVGPAVAPRRGGPKKAHQKFVEALYTYSPNGEGEVAMEEGERMVLVAPDGGDGWCEVEARAGRGIVPAGWVREV
ncbi:protein BZZ1-like [Teratosphaeria destructans]|uniref:Protein BZZ1 n=1 Tax=Teratosphaeria destructans TaxID=418781 RepID=A0A9W7SPB5_9PEZI|nr:protein BZZ1-like [Teratosphaeria destructans]